MNKRTTAQVFYICPKFYPVALALVTSVFKTEVFVIVVILPIYYLIIFTSTGKS
jgi:hypothetical protein